jgi:hypothetical protein
MLILVTVWSKAYLCGIAGSNPAWGKDIYLFILSNKQPQYSVFHKLMCWHSLTFRLPTDQSPPAGDLLYRVTGRMGGLNP